MHLAGGMRKWEIMYSWNALSENSQWTAGFGETGQKSFSGTAVLQDSNFFRTPGMTRASMSLAHPMPVTLLLTPRELYSSNIAKMDLSNGLRYRWHRGNLSAAI